MDESAGKITKSKSSNKIGRLLSGIKKLFRDGFFHILSGNFLNKAISMISSIVIVRLVDKVSYANFAYADNLYSYIALASGLGMSSALLKFCSADQGKSLDKAYVSFAAKVGGLFELIASVVLCLLVTVIDIPYAEARTFCWVLLLYPVIDYFVIMGSVYMRTQLDNKKYAYTGLIKSAMVCVFSIVFVLMFGVMGIISARYLAVICIVIYVFRYYASVTKGAVAEKLTKEQKSKFFKVGISLCVASFFSGIMPINEGFLVNNIIADPIITANFRVAGLLPQLLFLVSGAITVYYFPIVSRMKNRAEIKRKVGQVALVNTVVIFSLTALGMLFTPFIINLLYGEAYMDAVSISYLLWIMRASNCIVRMVPQNMLPAIGKTKFNMYASIVACVLQCVLDYVFIVSFGINGVALGATIVYIASGIAFWVYFMRVLNRKTEDIEND